MARRSESPRAHGSTAPNVCKVKGTTADSRKVVNITVQGRASEVRARIEARIRAGAQRMTFTDVTTERDFEISLAAGDKVAVS